jgi:XRE family aerobic/anaerobic benzoate catabolism transcriptional regulator
MSRVLAQGDLRPMADAPQAMEDLKAILDSRTPLYAKANAELMTSGRSETHALSMLVAIISAAAPSHPTPPAGAHE